MDLRGTSLGASSASSVSPQLSNLTRRAWPAVPHDSKMSDRSTIESGDHNGSSTRLEGVTPVMLPPSVSFNDPGETRAADVSTPVKRSDGEVPMGTPTMSHSTLSSSSSAAAMSHASWSVDPAAAAAAAEPTVSASPIDSPQVRLQQRLAGHTRRMSDRRGSLVDDSGASIVSGSTFVDYDGADSAGTDVSHGSAFRNPAWVPPRAFQQPRISMVDIEPYRTLDPSPDADHR